MRREEEKAAALLTSGKLDAEQLRKLTESRDGRKLKALLGDERTLAEAVEKGDAAVLQNALQTLLASPEGRRLFKQLGGMMGKG
jgi:hypothetical protein